MESQRVRHNLAIEQQQEAWNLSIALGDTVILTLLILLIHDYGTF